MTGAARRWLAAFACVALLGSAGAGQLAFGPESRAAIEREYAGRPFMLIFWASDCVPCRGELAMLGRRRARDPQMNLVLVATDDITNESVVTAVLADSGLAGVESWVFADRNVERLRYTVDPAWHGELPRTYFYGADRARTGISGALTEKHIARWRRP